MERETIGEILKSRADQYDEIKNLRTRLAAAEAELTEAYGYLSRLFKNIAPQCEPMEKLIFLCTQIDNYIAGTNEKLTAAEARVKGLEEVVDTLASAGCICRQNNEPKHRADCLVGKAQALLIPTQEPVCPKCKGTGIEKCNRIEPPKNYKTSAAGWRSR